MEDKGYICDSTARYNTGAKRADVTNTLKTEHRGGEDDGKGVGTKNDT